MSEDVTVKKNKVRKSKDIKIAVDKDLHIRFYEGEEFSKFPIIISEIEELKIPKEDILINRLFKKEVSLIDGNDAYRLMKYLNMDLTPFIWLMMIERDIDLYQDRNELHVKSDNSFISLSNKVVDLSLIDRLYTCQNRNSYYGVYNEINSELGAFIRKMISNKIFYSDLIKKESPEFKRMERNIETAIFSKEMNFPKILFLYENLIRFKEDFIKQHYDMKPKEDIELYYKQLKEIRRLVSEYHKIIYSIEEK